MNRRACTSRIWEWPTEPVSRIMSIADRGQIWVRRNDIAKWGVSFWAACRFLRVLAVGQSQRRRLCTGVFAELIGLKRELALPDNQRVARWFSAYSAPSRIGGINWRARDSSLLNRPMWLFPLLLHSIAPRITSMKLNSYWEYYVPLYGVIITLP